MKNTKKAVKIIKEINSFIEYYQKAQNRKPARVLIRKDQEDGLGIKCPHNHNGVMLTRHGAEDERSDDK